MANVSGPAGPELLVTEARQPRALVVLAHGAGQGAGSPFLTAMAAALASLGLTVARFNFPYMATMERTGRRRPPDRADILAGCYLEMVGRARDLAGAGLSLVIGGKSLGGRVATMVADQAGVDGVVCLGYPFHPPGKPERLRTGHLEKLRTPALICQGERDPFGTPAEITDYRLSPSIRLCWISDGDHGFKPRRKSGATLEENLAAAAAAIDGFIREL